MGLGKALVLGLLGISTAASLILTGAYASGYESKRSGARAATVELIGAVVTGLSFLALYFDW